MAEGKGLVANLLWSVSHWFYLIGTWFERSFGSIATGSEMGKLRPRQLVAAQLGPEHAAPFNWITFFAKATPIKVTTSTDALAFSLRAASASLAYCVAVTGERHPPHICIRKNRLPSLDKYAGCRAS